MFWVLMLHYFNSSYQMLQRVTNHNQKRKGNILNVDNQYDSYPYKSPLIRNLDISNWICKLKTQNIILNNKWLITHRTNLHKNERNIFK